MLRQKALCRILAGLLVLGCAPHAWAQLEKQTKLDPYRDFTTYDPPERYVHAYEVGVFNRHLVEFIPEGETLENWSRLLSFRTVVPAKLAVDANVYAAKFIASYDETCSEKSVQSFQLDPLESVFGIYCVNRPGIPLPGGPGLKHEVTLFRVIRTEEALYQIHFSWHADDQDLDRKEVQQKFYVEAAALIDTIKICNLGSGVPCPGLDVVFSEQGIVTAPPGPPCERLPKEECKPVAMFDATAHKSATVTKERIPFMPVKFDEIELDDMKVINQLAGGIAKQFSEGAPGIALVFRHSSPAHRVSLEERLEVATFLNLLRTFLIAKKLVEPDSVDIKMVNFR